MQFDPQSISELMEFIKSPAGQQLMVILQEKGGVDLASAITKAKNGEYSEAKSIVSSILKDPQASDLLKHFGR